MKPPTRNVPLVVCALLALTCGCKRSASRPETRDASARSAASGCASMTGDYAIRASRAPGGTTGRGGTVAITTREDTCRLRWDVTGEPSYAGVGIKADRRLAVGWGMGKEYGVSIYTVTGGSLKGVEAENASGDLATEDLEGPPGLDGDYSIVKAATHRGVPYGGRVAIKPSGAAYALEWETECRCDAGPRKQRYVGVGIKDGDKLVVAWGTPGSDVGVVDYTVGTDVLEGTRATYGGTSLGLETLARK